MQKGRKAGFERGNNLNFSAPSAVHRLCPAAWLVSLRFGVTTLLVFTFLFSYFHLFSADGCGGVPVSVGVKPGA